MKGEDFRTGLELLKEEYERKRDYHLRRAEELSLEIEKLDKAIQSLIS